MGSSTPRLTLKGQPEVEICLRRTARAKRMSLRVSRLDGKVTLSIPDRTAIRHAEVFLAEKSDWIRRHLDDIPTIVAVTHGSVMAVEGREVTVAVTGARGIRLSDHVLGVAGSRPVGPQVAAFLKETARERFTTHCNVYAAEIGHRVNKITLRDARSRWGSCTSEGNLMFSWRLAMAPPEVLEYVAAHEVAHLERMDHSPAFWRVVEHLCPHYRAHRRWLRNEGHGLHRFRFSA
ncbi:M48 family metallopeptidase [Qingshengfaniella alkalisoli]|uniref:M48 family metallopeptidase n=1 Tax=Qingshengfaniella alkalisoli TaxID=2599296 RepID=A0A5B8IS18_9RHOB|nr:SprT family zinc-dependent metalloprotease [Qingshengfaniella alkalisoli]QDY68384.1 M48 family metallopeptidase [Qingshengfaniella alkalisoli]